jgi:Na+/H+ ion antiporter subunit
MNKGENIFSGLPAVVRWLVFLGTWFVLYGPDLAALPVGVGAAVAATWTSLRLLPPGSFHPQLGSLFVLALRFVWQSVVAGIDVARRALEPDSRCGRASWPIPFACGRLRHGVRSGKPAARNAADRPG